MSLEKIGQVKKSKLFAKWDILVYSLLLAVILSLFVGFVFAATPSALQGIVIEYDNQTVFTYDFATDTYNIDAAGQNTVKVEDDGSELRVTVTYENEFNLIIIEKSGRAYIKDADCSYHKDCTSMQAICDSNGIIICVPHKLTVKAQNYEENPVTGG